ncbi:hypothetical protein D1AOALGA4SA_11503 [Olavius algarvensis Delta 1 endosymbiont]|nr:hypothetical protein D1AOALGA4SA_11503 [Olavius algarvensis Delta 1 endosymbiont]
MRPPARRDFGFVESLQASPSATTRQVALSIVMDRIKLVYKSN